MPSRLATSFASLAAGTLYKQWKSANPAEARKLESYVAQIEAGDAGAPPALATQTGKGLVGLCSLAVRSGLPLLMGGGA